jgi:cytochrome P450
VIQKAWQWLQNPYAYLDQQVARNGLTFRDRIPVLGRVLFTGDPVHTARIALDPIFRDKKAYSSLTDILGKTSLITLQGDAHSQRRKTLSAGFRASLLANYDAAVDLAVAEEIAQARPRSSAFELIQAINLKITIHTLFCLGPLDESKLVILALKFMNSFSSPLNLFVPGLKFELAGLSPWGRAMANRRELVFAIKQILSKVSDESVIGAVLPLFLESSVPESELIDEIISLVMFGHDTTAAALSWAVTYLAQSPDLASQIFDEAKLATTASGQLDFTQLTLTEACLNESLRLSPPVVHLNRVAIENTSFGTIKIQAGDAVLPSAYIAHRNPDIFDSPAEYSPLRFLSEIPRGSFFPYGLGHRTCIGKPMAHRQMTIALASLVKHSVFVPMADFTTACERHLVLIRPKGGGRILFRRRQPVRGVRAVRARHELDLS